MQENQRKTPVSLKLIACISAFFFLSYSKFSFAASPFPFAFAAALSPLCSLTAAAGIIMSCISSGNMQSVQYVSAVILIPLLSVFIKKNDALKRGIAVALCFMLSFVFFCITEKFSLRSLAVFSTASVLAGFVCGYTVILLNSPRGIIAEAAVNKPAIALLCFSAVSVLSSFSFFGINPGEIAAVFFTLVYARNYRFAGGSTAGITGAAALIINGAADIRSVVFMGISGMAAGTFINYGRPAAASAYLLVSVMCTAVSGAGMFPVMSYVNIVAGIIFFCMVPVEKVHNEEKRISSTFDEESDMMRISSFRMRLVANTIGNAAEKPESFNEIKKNYAGNAGSIADITESEYRTMSKNILAEQLTASSEIIRSLSSDVQKRFIIDRRITSRMKTVLNENDIGFVSLVAYYNSSRRLFAEIYCPKNSCVSGYRIYRTLSDEFGINFECTKCYDGEEMRFLSERPAYRIEAEISQKSSASSEENGDTCLCFRDSYGKFYIVISDGMGTGKRAFEYSSRAVGLFRQFILGGVDAEQSIRIINTIIRSESTDDYFATLDVAAFDLDNGNMTVYKSGAAPTIFLHGGSIFSVNSPTFPIGAADTAGMFKRTFSLKTGDMVTMISDGVPEKAYGVIKRELTEKSDVSEISENICRLSQKISYDDVSVITARLVRQ